MYSYLNGILTEIEEDTATIDINGIGYELKMGSNDLNTLSNQLNEKVLIRTQQIIREDSHELFGFITKEKKDIFNILRSLNGIGPKSALQILSNISLEELIEAIFSNDVATLVKIPGIGKKTAERMILELKDKLPNISKELRTEKTSTQKIEQRRLLEINDAMLSLGYRPNEIKRIIENAELDATMSIEEMLTKILKGSR